MLRRQPRSRLARKLRIRRGLGIADHAAEGLLSKRRTLTQRYRLKPRSINSTRWRESMTDFSSDSDHTKRAEIRPDLPELISQLEWSLHAGQQALLLLDLEKLEEQTALQASLSQVLAESLDDLTLGGNTPQAGCSRVIHLCRVQLGLLRRAQRSLRVLSNLLAGAEGTYVPRPGAGEPRRAVLHKEV